MFILFQVYCLAFHHALTRLLAGLLFVTEHFHLRPLHNSKVNISPLDIGDLRATMIPITEYDIFEFGTIQPCSSEIGSL